LRRFVFIVMRLQRPEKEASLVFERLGSTLKNKVKGLVKNSS
jgi:hypothetical protein